jgi:Putative zinc-finger
MAGDAKNAMQCSQFEALLADAAEGTLAGAQLEGFQAHARICPNCGPLFREAESGRQWVKQLEEVEPPPHLVMNILVATTGLQTNRFNAVVSGRASWWERFTAAVLSPVMEVARQPRFVMSFGMAFFSLSLTLTLTGVKLGDLRHVDLRPSAVKRTYYETSGRVVKYYENIRFVYEIESRVREFKRVTAPVEPAPQEKPKERKNNSSEGPEQPKQERNYSQGESQPVLAALPNNPPVVTETAYRRFL